MIKQLKLKHLILTLASLSIIIFAVTLAIFFVFQKQNSFSDGIISLNQRIKSVVEQNDAEDNLEDLLTTRKDKIINDIKNDFKLPENYELSDENIDKIPEELSYLVESEVTVKGDLNKVEIDYKNGESKNKYALTLPDGNRTDVYFEKEDSEVSSSKEVTLSGLALDNVLFVPSSRALSAASAALANPLNVTGNKNILVLKANFSDNPSSQPYSDVEIRNELLDDADSTGNFFSEQSYGKYNLATLTVSSQWFTVPDGSTASCEDNYSSWGNNITSQAVAAGYDVESFDNVLYVFDPATSCPIAGIGSISGAWSMYFGYNDSRVYAHELGHNIGVEHAANYDCADKVIDIYVNCMVEEYGDYYDVMGYVWSVVKPIHFNAPHKYLLGWLNDSNVTTVTANGIYAVNNLENQSTGTQAIRIYRPETSDYYYFEYRKPVGFDSSLSDWGYSQTGAIGHIWNDNKNEMTYLLDFQPNQSINSQTDFKSPTLIDNIPFYDAVNGIRITQSSHTDDTVMLTVAVNILTPSVTVNSLATNVSTPTITGTVSDPTLEVNVSIDGAPAIPAAVNPSTGVWSLVSNILSNGIHNIVATIIVDEVSITDVTTNELTIDTIMPIVTLTGATTIDAGFGAPFTDPGATFTDNMAVGAVTITGDLSMTVGPHVRTYTKIDPGGNTAFVTRTVLVLPSDIASTEFAVHIRTLVGARVVAGHQDGTFRPNTNLTRAEAIALIVRASGKAADPINPATIEFADVPASHWAHNVILIARQNNIVAGVGNNRFNPGATITRAELAKMIANNLPTYVGSSKTQFTDSVNHWAAAAILKVSNYNIVNGFNADTFGPEINATRGQAAKIINNMMARL